MDATTATTRTTDAGKEDEEAAMYFALHLFVQHDSMLNMGLACPLCGNGIRQATETVACKHVFCRSCITGKTHCPIPTCKRQLVDAHASCETKSGATPPAATVLQPSPAIQNLVDRLQVRCVHAPQCKDFVGPRSALKQHVTVECKHVSVGCEGCHRQMPRGELQAHRENDCPARRVRCVWCNGEEKAADLDAHKEFRCQLKIVSCPAKCDPKLTLTRQQMAIHVAHECPNAFVACPLLHLCGCTLRQERKLMSQHVGDPQALAAHLTGLSVKFNALQTAHDALQQAVCGLRNQVAALQTDVAGVQQEQNNKRPTPDIASTLMAKRAVQAQQNYEQKEEDGVVHTQIKLPTQHQQQQQRRRRSHTGHFLWSFGNNSFPMAGDVLDVQDRSFTWRLAQVRAQLVDDMTGLRQIHVGFIGLTPKEDEWLRLPRHPASGGSDWHRVNPPFTRTRKPPTQEFVEGWSCCGESEREQSSCAAAPGGGA